jgi:restriction system protein
MALPNFQQLMLPTLRHICQVNDEVQISVLEHAIARTLSLSDDDLSRVLPSGQQSVFSNRLNWARSYMTKAGLLEAPRRSYCRATQRARDLIAEAPKEIDLTILSRYPEFVAWRSQQKAEDPAPTSDGKSNPEELIAINFELLNRELASELVQRVHSFSPAFFER